MEKHTEGELHDRWTAGQMCAHHTCRRSCDDRRLRVHVLDEILSHLLQLLHFPHVQRHASALSSLDRHRVRRRGLQAQTCEAVVLHYYVKPKKKGFTLFPVYISLNIHLSTECGKAVDIPLMQERFSLVGYKEQVERQRSSFEEEEQQQGFFGLHSPYFQMGSFWCC